MQSAIRKVLGVVACLCSSAAVAGLITFDDLRGGHMAAGELVTDQYAGLGVTFFDSHPGGAHADNVLAPRPAYASSPNYLWVDQWSGGLRTDHFLQVNFASPVRSVGLIYFISLDTDMTVDLYDGDQLVSTNTGSGTYIGADVVVRRVSFTSDSITALRMYSHNQDGASVNFGIDNLEWTGAARQVPEPGGQGLALAALLAAWAGTVLSRRRL